MSFSSKVKAEIEQVFGEHSHCRTASLSAIMNATTGLLENDIDHIVIERTCCKRTYLRSAFICAGSVNGPGKVYHLEFIANDNLHCQQIISLLRSFSLSPKSSTRKGKYVVYFKESEQIAEVLNIIGAHKSLLEFENNRAEKEIGNSINRLANCETANIDKSISAAVKQIEGIKTIANTIGLDALDAQLYECATLRLNNPELSLAEIGQKLLPPIGKSGVSHRFRRISEIANELTNPTERGNNDDRKIN